MEGFDIKLEGLFGSQVIPLLSVDGSIQGEVRNWSSAVSKKNVITYAVAIIFLKDNGSFSCESLSVKAALNLNTPSNFFSYSKCFSSLSSLMRFLLRIIIITFLLGSLRHLCCILAFFRWCYYFVYFWLFPFILLETRLPNGRCTRFCVKKILVWALEPVSRKFRVGSQILKSKFKA